MALEPLSPELVLVDPELGARARAALAAPSPAVSAPRPAHATPATRAAVPAPVVVEARRLYPIWARATAALWLVVLGILIGGAAIPHAQDRPRIVPADEASICELPPETAPEPELPRPATEPPSAPGATR